MFNNTGKLSERELSFTSTVGEGRTFLCITVRRRSPFPEEINVSSVLGWRFQSQIYYLNSNVSAFAWLVFLSNSTCRTFCVQGTGTFAAEYNDTNILQGPVWLGALREPFGKGKVVWGSWEGLSFLGRPYFSQNSQEFFHILLILLPWRQSQQVWNVYRHVLDNMVGGDLIVNQ
jgi:hypothetical protein